MFRELGDTRRLANALRARGFAEAFGGSLAAPAPTSTRRWTIYHDIDDERGHAWTHQNLAWVAFQGGDFDEAEVQLAEATAAVPGARRPHRRELGRGPAGLGVVLPAALRRGRGAGAGRRVGCPPLGRPVGDADDADPARQPAAVDRSPGGRRAVRRAGAGRVPRDQRPIRRHAGAGSAQPGAGRTRQEGRRQAWRRGVDRPRGHVRRARTGAASGGRRRHAPRAGRAGRHTRRAGARACRHVGHEPRRGLRPAGARALPDRRCRRGVGGHRARRCRGLPVRPQREGPRPRHRGRRRGRHRGCRAVEQDARRQLLRLVRRSPGRRHGLRPGGRPPGQPALARFVDITGVEVGDVVFVAVAQRLHERPVSETASEPSTLAAGWRRVVDAVVVG